MNTAGQTLVFMDVGIFYGLVMLLGRCWSTSFLKCALVINGMEWVSKNTAHDCKTGISGIKKKKSETMGGMKRCCLRMICLITACKSLEER